MWRHYVYVHKKADCGEVFYVGKGSVRVRHKTLTHERAHCRTSRSAWWHRTVSLHGLAVEITASCRTDADAQNLERLLIAQVGRRDTGAGALVNLTDGGDWHSGLVVSAATRLKRSEQAKRPRSESWRASIRRARKNGGNGGVVRKGDKLPAGWRANIGAAKLGAGNPMYGRTGDDHPTARRVVDIASGATFPSVTAAAREYGLRMQRLHNMLTGFRPNRTPLRFA